MLKQHPYQATGLTVVIALLVAFVVGSLAIEIGDLPPFPWMIVATASGILAGTGGLALGFAHSTTI